MGVKNINVCIFFLHIGPHGIKPFCGRIAVYTPGLISHFPEGHVVTQLKSDNATNTAHEFFITEPLRKFLGFYHKKGTAHWYIVTCL
jgi:hypothetical protein